MKYYEQSVYFDSMINSTVQVNLIGGDGRKKKIYNFVYLRNMKSGFYPQNTVSREETNWLDS